MGLELEAACLEHAQPRDPTNLSRIGVFKPSATKAPPLVSHAGSAGLRPKAPGVIGLEAQSFGRLPHRTG